MIGLANFLKHGTPVQNEQGDVKLGVFHMDLFTKYEDKKSWLWQSRVFTENLTIGRIEYRITEHQHTVEVERELSLLAGREIRVTLTTQVVPLSRGIMSTLYGSLTKSSTTAQELYDAYAEFYRGAKFVRVEPTGIPVSNNDVRGSNFSVISTNVDARTGRMIVVSHIDNLMKGQAGSALQNMNIMFGLEEDRGLKRPAYYP